MQKSCSPLTAPLGGEKEQKAIRDSHSRHGHEGNQNLYPRNRAGYEFFQCCWYDLGKRQTRRFGEPDDAKLFAQQKSVALASGLPSPCHLGTGRNAEAFGSLPAKHPSSTGHWPRNSASGRMRAGAPPFRKNGRSGHKFLL